MNAQLFSDYFGGVPVLSIPGRTFPVEQHFLETVFDITGYVLEEGAEYCRKNYDSEFFQLSLNAPAKSVEPSNKIKDEDLAFAQLLARYKDYTHVCCKNICLMDPTVVNNELIESLLMWIVFGEHKYPRQGTILVFLPGIAEITNLYDQLAVHKEFGSRNNKYLVLPLHSSLSSEEQGLIFR